MTDRKGLLEELTLAAPLVLGAVAAGAVLYVLQDRGVTPRALAPYVELRSSGHNDTIVGTGKWLGSTLMDLDRGSSMPQAPAFAGVGVGSFLACGGTCECAVPNPVSKAASRIPAARRRVALIGSLL